MSPKRCADFPPVCSLHAVAQAQGRGSAIRRMARMVVLAHLRAFHVVAELDEVD